MTYQEYEKAVGELYLQTKGIGSVHRNVRIPDRITGSLRQIDVLLKIVERGHTLSIMIDAKFRKEALDVKDVEEVYSLASAVGAHKAVIVTANGWNNSAEAKAHSLSMDLRILGLEEALELIVVDKWKMCSNCEKDCIVLDQDGATIVGGMWIWWLGGQCRNCKTSRINCQDCGTPLMIKVGDRGRCLCGIDWISRKDGILIDFLSEN